MNLEKWLFGWFFFNVGNTCQQCYIGIQGSQVTSGLGSLFGVGKFEMHYLLGDLHRQEDWPPLFLASLRSHIGGHVLIVTINSNHSFVVFFDALSLFNIDPKFFLLDVPFCFCSRFSPYFDDIRVTTFLSFHLTKAILGFSSITTLADPLSSFCISFTGFNSAFSFLFNRTVPVAAILFYLNERSNWGLVKKLLVMTW